METDVWLEGLPQSLAVHRAMLSRLLLTVQRDPLWRWLELSCSLARGEADALSDLDLGLGAADDRWEIALDRLPQLATQLGDTLGMLNHQLASWRST
ncbi:MAG: hypothetical protein ACREN8_03785 [Candidatus Dormibacteraceae bacterium]